MHEGKALIDAPKFSRDIEDRWPSIRDGSGRCAENPTFAEETLRPGRYRPARLILPDGRIQLNRITGRTYVRTALS